MDDKINIYQILQAIIIAMLLGVGMMVLQLRDDVSRMQVRMDTGADARKELDRRIDNLERQSEKSRQSLRPSESAKT